MKNVTEALDAFRGRPPFRCRDLARVTGMSRQAALVHLRRAVLSGRLIIRGAGRRTRYLYPSPPTTWEAPEISFWADIEHRAQPFVLHLDIYAATGGSCRTASQADAVLPGSYVGRAFTFLDFDRVTSVTPSFARAVIRWIRFAGTRPLVINALPRVALVLEQARCVDERTPGVD